MFHYFHFAKGRTSASILMVAPFALGPQNADALAQKKRPHPFFLLCLRRGNGIHRNCRADTLPFTTTFSPANLSNCFLSPFKV